MSESPNPNDEWIPNINPEWETATYDITTISTPTTTGNTWVTTTIEYGTDVAPTTYVNPEFPEVLREHDRRWPQPILHQRPVDAEEPRGEL